MTRLCAAALVAVAPLFVRADPLPTTLSDTVADFSAGIYCPGAPLRRDAAPGTTSGSINIVDAPAEFLVETQLVPAVPGLGFGILITLLPGETRDVTVFVTHPPFGGSGDTQEMWTTDFEDTPSLNGFTFEHGYELQPGAWTFRAEGPDGPIYEITFDVVPPAAAPELAALCSAAILS